LFLCSRLSLMVPPDRFCRLRMRTILIQFANVLNDVQRPRKPFAVRSRKSGLGENYPARRR
jgi:hypothetical protein